MKQYVTSDELLKKAWKTLEDGKKEEGVKQLIVAADQLASNTEYEKAAKVYEEAALIYKDLYDADECFKTFDKATLMLVRLPQDDDVYTELVRLNTAAAKIADAATEYKKAADFYFRAKDFAMSNDVKQSLNIRAADALENIADAKEEEENYADAIGLLRKVSILYFSADDDELGERINTRAVKIAQHWAEISKSKGDFLSAGNALAEAAQIMQSRGESPEATRTALRDVVGHCMYGVDLNPMAVELCKVSLWMEALEPGKPLSFLDHHIQCGNSLLGTTPALLV